ncbi:hypothetical protein ACPA9J_14145 [Pseudomonas aeruginosa]
MFTTSLTGQRPVVPLLQGALTTSRHHRHGDAGSAPRWVSFLGPLRAPAATAPACRCWRRCRSAPRTCRRRPSLSRSSNSFKSILGPDWSAFAVAWPGARRVRRRLLHRGVRRRRPLGTAERAPGGAFPGLRAITGPVPHCPAGMGRLGWPSPGVNRTLSVMKDTSLVLSTWHRRSNARLADHRHAHPRNRSSCLHRGGLAPLLLMSCGRARLGARLEWRWQQMIEISDVRAKGPTASSRWPGGC